MNEAALLDKISNRLSKKRLIHTLAVKEEAIKLAECYGYDNEEHVVLAALLHDIGREYDQNTMNTYVKKYKLDNIYLNNISLAHSKVGAELIKDEFQVNNKDIINAVSFHTTGKENMSLLEKIIFLADIIEPNRMFNDIEALRVLSYENIDEACLLALDLSIKYVIERKEYLHIDTLLARNYLLINKGGKNGQ
ncbi:MAG: bis(5'-nucleosyl)-tetraphosphatase (symmetrical) YqeK [Clostridia bacterium]|nr:bis(5'-nucleosyl)-tetraphosphatase (symmetrical) YqeK [Clostridia bacterium]